MVKLLSDPWYAVIVALPLSSSVYSKSDTPWDFVLNKTIANKLKNKVIKNFSYIKFLLSIY